MKMAVFWDVAPCSFVDIERHLIGACCLHHQGGTLKRRPVSTSLHDATSQKTVIFILVPMRILNFTKLIEVAMGWIHRSSGGKRNA
jgi:hypothetical protein